MLRNRLLILVLISCVTLREDTSFLVISMALGGSAVTLARADANHSVEGEGDLSVTSNSNETNTWGQGGQNFRFEAEFAHALEADLKASDAWHHADGDQSFHDDVKLHVARESDSNLPEENPSNDGEAPIIFESDPEVQVEEMAYPGCHSIHLWSSGHCLLDDENNLLLSTSFNSFCTFKRLRT